MPVSPTSWWNETKSPRWQLVVGAIGTALLTSVGTYFVTNWENDRKRTVDSRAEQVRSVIDSMIQFQVLVSNFSTEFFNNGKISTDARVSLNKNLNEQFAKIRSIESFLSPSDRELAEAHLAAIKDLIIVAGQVGSGTGDNKMREMAPFWSSVAKLTLSRNKLNKELQNTI